MDEVAIVGGILGGIALIHLIVWTIVFLSFAVTVGFQIAGMWKMFEKAGKPGWAALVPFYGPYIQTEITIGCGWYFLLAMIPYIGFVYNVYLCYNLSKSFGYPWPFTIGLVLVPYVFYPIIGFSKNPYLGVTKNIFNQNDNTGVI